ncbi:MAG TPA: hypothetical protein VK110_03350, partial [Salinisphaeraceae bacterium]|nr:hypothetical protein [Salinisphaeraceae bacterium]
MSEVGSELMKPAQQQPRRWLLGRDTWHLLWVISPGVLWIVLFLVLPSMLLIGIAFMTNGI